jgi:hypothetical protein
VAAYQRRAMMPDPMGRPAKQSSKKSIPDRLFGPYVVDDNGWLVITVIVRYF